MPALGCAESRRAVTIIPPNAAKAPAIAYTVIFTFLILMPDSFAACSLPPIAYIYRPSFVFCVMNTAISTTTIASQTGTGIPINEPEPMNAKSFPRLLIGWPFVYNMVNPLAIVSIARVATKGGTLNFVTVNPLNQPSNAPNNKPASNAPVIVNPTNKSDDGNSNPFLKRPAVTAPHNANTEPTDKSMPPVNTISVIPVAMQALTAT